MSDINELKGTNSSNYITNENAQSQNNTAGKFKYKLYNLIQNFILA